MPVMGAELMQSRNLIPSLCKNSAVTIYIVIVHAAAICRDKCDAMCHGDNWRRPRVESHATTSFFLLSARRVKGDIKINPNDLIFAS